MRLVGTVEAKEEVRGMGREGRRECGLQGREVERMGAREDTGKSSGTGGRERKGMVIAVS